MLNFYKELVVRNIVSYIDGPRDLTPQADLVTPDKDVKLNNLKAIKKIVEDGKIDTEEAKEIIDEYDGVSSETKDALKKVGADIVSSGFNTKDQNVYNSYRELLLKLDTSVYIPTVQEIADKLNEQTTFLKTMLGGGYSADSLSSKDKQFGGLSFSGDTVKVRYNVGGTGDDTFTIKIGTDGDLEGAWGNEVDDGKESTDGVDLGDKNPDLSSVSSNLDSKITDKEEEIQAVKDAVQKREQTKKALKIMDEVGGSLEYNGETSTLTYKGEDITDWQTLDYEGAKQLVEIKKEEIDKKEKDAKVADVMADNIEGITYNEESGNLSYLGTEISSWGTKEDLLAILSSIKQLGELKKEIDELLIDDQTEPELVELEEYKKLEELYNSSTDLQELRTALDAYNAKKEVLADNAFDAEVDKSEEKVEGENTRYHEIRYLQLLGEADELMIEDNNYPDLVSSEEYNRLKEALDAKSDLIEIGSALEAYKEFREKKAVDFANKLAEELTIENRGTVNLDTHVTVEDGRFRYKEIDIGDLSTTKGYLQLRIDAINNPEISREDLENLDNDENSVGDGDGSERSQESDENSVGDGDGSERPVVNSEAESEPEPESAATPELEAPASAPEVNILKDINETTKLLTIKEAMELCKRTADEVEGVSAEQLYGLLMAENTGRINDEGTDGQSKGLFQMLQGTFKEIVDKNDMGGDANINNPIDNAKAAGLYLAQMLKKGDYTQALHMYATGVRGYKVLKRERDAGSIARAKKGFEEYVSSNTDGVNAGEEATSVNEASSTIDDMSNDVHSTLTKFMEENPGLVRIDGGRIYYKNPSKKTGFGYLTIKKNPGISKTLGDPAGTKAARSAGAAMNTWDFLRYVKKINK